MVGRMSRQGKKKKQPNFVVTFANGDTEVMEIDNYCFTRINKYLKLKRTIREVHDWKSSHVQELQNGWVSSISDFFTGKFFDSSGKSSYVDSYWSTGVGKQDFREDYMKDCRVFDVIILQRTFRIWIFLMRLRRIKQTEMQSPKKYSGETQTKEQKEEHEYRLKLIQKQIQSKKKLVAKFCRCMVDGKYKEVRIFIAGQSSMLNSPLFRFSNDIKSIQTSIRSFELSGIYDVQVGLTNESKRILRLQDDKCLHIKFTGKIILEIEAKSTEDASQLFTGFKVLKNCLISMYSFSIIDGIPRRLVSTIIEKLIQDGQTDIDESKSVNSDSQKQVPFQIPSGENQNLSPETGAVAESNKSEKNTAKLRNVVIKVDSDDESI